MASSSAIPTKEKYDVFISFRGADTREKFTSHLHAALIRRKIDTYIDYRLEKGEELEAAILKAIEESKVYVIIFSEDYASSTWCLKELAHILECQERNGHYVIPVFYGIDPSDVRSQKRSYETAFSKHEQRLDLMDKVLKWKGALTKAANVSGFDSTSRTIRDDNDLIEQVVEDVLTKLNRDCTSNVTDHLVGVESRIQSIVMELDIIPSDSRVRFVVIWGMGGIGKTTLADAVFHGLSSQFEACCFLENVGARSGAKRSFSPQLKDLRDELLRQLLGERDLAIHTPTIDSYVKKRLNRTKVFVVLDDINHISQLEFLAGEQVTFGPGSRIIITTRDFQLVRKMQVGRQLADHDLKIYKVKELNGAESLKFLHSNAYTDSTRNSEIFERVVTHAAGVPLALKVLQPLFLQCKSREELETLWDKLKKFPNTELQDVYRISYEGLERNEREIFLDIACFHNRVDICHVKRILSACGLFPNDGIKILSDMSLISLKNDCIWMHDVIQEMGVTIVNEECAEDPGNRSRLHNYEDISHVLENNTGTAKVQSICSTNNYDRLTLSPQAFTVMHNLRFLMLSCIHVEGEVHLEFLPNALKYLLWDNWPLKSLPSKFSPKYLVELHMSWSSLRRLWNNGQNPVNLKFIDLSYSKDLVEVAFLSNCVNIESINLRGCISLVQIPDLTKSVYIKSINLGGCAKLARVPDLSNSVNIESINLERCHNLVTIPSYFENFTKLTYLNLFGCLRISIVANICKLKSIEMLNLSGCIRFTDFPEILEPMERLKCLDLSETNIEKLPNCFNSLPALESLDLSRTKIQAIPPTIKRVSGLKSLLVSGCEQLQSLPVLPCLLEVLDATNCTSLTTVSVFATALTQGLDQIFLSEERKETYIFTGCFKMDKSTRSNIMDDAYLRIMRMASACNLKPLSSGKVVLKCEGSEIPQWFNCQTDGSSMNIKLPVHWSDTKFFLGFALSVVCENVYCSDEDPNDSHFWGGTQGVTQCEMILKTDNGKDYSFNLGGADSFMDSDKATMLMWYNKLAAVPDEAKWSTEASFNFYVENRDSFPFRRKEQTKRNRRVRGASKCLRRLNCVRRCGVFFLYADGHSEVLKFEVIHPQEVTRRPIDDQASASQVPGGLHYNGTETHGELFVLESTHGEFNGSESHYPDTLI